MQVRFTVGLEDGFIASIISYARLPQTMDELGSKAETLAGMLANELCQASFSIEGPITCDYYQNDSIKK